MNPAQEEHLARIIDTFSKEVASKYRAGQQIHGGDLWDRDVLEDAIEEALDLVVYLYTLREKLQENNLDK